MALPQPEQGSTALVTGASSGIGVELARELARRGHDVTLAARREDRLRAVAAEIERDFGVRADVVVADVSTEDGRAALVAAVADTRVEILVNNAGYGSAGRFQSLDGGRETLMVRTNCEAIIALCAEFVPKMIERGRGAVLNVASTAAFQPLPYQATYSATKAFVLTFTDALTADLHGTGVTATALCPGPVPTEFSAQAGIDEGGWDDVPKFAVVSAEKAASTAIAGVAKGKRVVIPGAVNRFGAASGQYTPRGILLGVMRRFYPVGR